MKTIYVLRDLFFTQQASLGTCIVYDENDNQLTKLESLERGFIDNKNRISCIPEGDYDLVLEKSPRFRKDLWEIYGVPGRSECKFHVSNYWWQLNGCIALGINRAYLDGDYVMDVTSSRTAMKKFHEALQGETKAILKVRNVLAL